MTSTTPPSSSSSSSPVSDLIPKFTLTRLLSSDQAGRRISLLGTIDNLPALLIAERAAFDTSPASLTTFPTSVQNITTLGANDIYFWFLANNNSSRATTPAAAPTATPPPPDYKINLIYPCTEKHIAKYSPQRLRLVTETPDLYAAYIRPFMAAHRAKGTLTWIYNILDGKTEQDQVIYRSPPAPALGSNPSATPADDPSAFLLLPDLNWDRKTMTTLHLLGLVARRDVWSVRDLHVGMVDWLRDMRDKMLDATVDLYGAATGLERDELKCYVHYQPTYYHFHIHIVHVALEAGTTQATGKALGLENIISQLETMADADATNGNAADSPAASTDAADSAPPPRTRGMHNASLTYHVGEQTDLWQKVYGPLKQGMEVDVQRF